MGNIETTTKFCRLKSISRIEDDGSVTLVIYLFSSLSLQLQKKTSSFMVKKIISEIGFKEVWVLKDFLNLFVFGFLFTLIFFREQNVHWNYIM